jgi:hypothetical protein
MRYFNIETNPLWIYRFGDDAHLAEHVDGYFQECGAAPADDGMILREDGAVCRFTKIPGNEEFLDFGESGDLVDIPELSALASALSARYGISKQALRVTDASEIASVLDRLCDRKDQLQQRWNWILMAVFIGPTTSQRRAS